MQTLERVADLRAAVRQWRHKGESIAFVPTMGNLHRGHLELVSLARQKADRVVVSIFVNPTQFGPNEDFDSYPRTPEQDSAALLAAGVDVLFMPDVAQVYPRASSQGAGLLTNINVSEITGILCGASRPGHFDGVATVVNILLNLVQPDCAIFGEKDYQQLSVIRRMCSDLHLPVEIIGAPIVRAEDGLALSSRNQYLSDDERARAPLLQAVLQEVAVKLQQGSADIARLTQDAEEFLSNHGFEVDYCEILGPDLGLASDGGPWVILVAAQLGRARLIDNLQVELVG